MAMSADDYLDLHASIFACERCGGAIIRYRVTDLVSHWVDVSGNRKCGNRKSRHAPEAAALNFAQTTALDHVGR
jgi:hypothetical protein